MITFTYFQFAAFLIYMYFAVGIYVILRLQKEGIIMSVFSAIFWPVLYFIAGVRKLL